MLSVIVSLKFKRSDCALLNSLWNPKVPRSPHWGPGPTCIPGSWLYFSFILFPSGQLTLLVSQFSFLFITWFQLSSFLPLCPVSIRQQQCLPLLLDLGRPSCSPGGADTLWQLAVGQSRCSKSYRTSSVHNPREHHLQCRLPKWYTSDMAYLQLLICGGLPVVWVGMPSTLDLPTHPGNSSPYNNKDLPRPHLTAAVLGMSTQQTY